MGQEQERPVRVSTSQLNMCASRRRACDIEHPLRLRDHAETPTDRGQPMVVTGKEHAAVRARTAEGIECSLRVTSVPIEPHPIGFNA